MLLEVFFFSSFKKKKMEDLRLTENMNRGETTSTSSLVSLGMNVEQEEMPIDHSPSVQVQVKTKALAREDDGSSPESKKKRTIERLKKYCEKHDVSFGQMSKKEKARKRRVRKFIVDTFNSCTAGGENDYNVDTEMKQLETLQSIN